MRSPLVGVIAMAVLVPLASESGARQQPVTVELKGCCTAKILSAKRARTWEGATDRGFTVKSAPEGRDFIVVKYELTP
ncbi:MAG: hypothetical protein ACRDFW_06980, partial [bacterium]